MSHHVISPHICQKFAEIADLKWGSKPTWKCLKQGLKQPMTGDAPPGIKSDQHHGFAESMLLGHGRLWIYGMFERRRIS